MHYLKDPSTDNVDDSRTFEWDVWSKDKAQDPLDSAFDEASFYECLVDPNLGSDQEDWAKGTQRGIYEAKLLAKKTSGYFFRHTEKSKLPSDPHDDSANKMAKSVARKIVEWVEKRHIHSLHSWVASQETVSHLRSSFDEFLEFSLFNCESVSVQLYSESKNMTLDLHSDAAWNKYRIALNPDSALWKTEDRAVSKEEFVQVLSNIQSAKIQFRIQSSSTAVGLDNLMIAEPFPDESFVEESN